MTKLMFFAGIFCAVLTPAHGSTLSTAFGAAADYNVFVFNNFSDSCCDVGGNLAVGGTVTANNFAVAQSQIVSAGQTGYYSFDVGGNIAGSVALSTGTAYLGGTGTLFLNNGSTRAATCGQNGFNCLNFATAKTSLQSYSTFLSSQTNNATTVADAGDGYDIIATKPGLNVATLTAAQLAAGALHITLPTGATLLINIIPDGTNSASTSNHGIFINGSQSTGDGATIAESIVFNFGGTSLTTNESITGSILAPFATVTGGGQQIDGQLIANNFTGGAEFHDLLFQGTLPSMPSVPTPEPTSFLLLGAGLIVLGTQSTRLKS